MASTNPVNQSVKLTKLVVDRAPLPATGQAILRDAELKGFGLRITAGGAKSFIVEKRVKGRVQRITLGRYPGITAEQARKEAQKLVARIVTGEDPRASQLRASALAVALAKAYQDFLTARAHNLKPRTLYDYRRLMAVAFPDWQTRAVSAITKDMVAKRHRELGESRGEAYANYAMRFLRALLNFARAQYEDPTTGASILAENPVSRLTHTRAWYRIDRRQSVIRRHQLPAWLEAVESLKAGRLRFKGRPIIVESKVSDTTPDDNSKDSSSRSNNPSSHSNRFARMLDTNVRMPLDRYDNSSKTLESRLATASRQSLETSRETPENSSMLNTAETVADYLLLLLFTGLRRQEAARLRWENVDLLECTLTIPDPKNHEPLTLPLSSFVYELLSSRSSRAINEYVFPGSGIQGYLIEPRAAIQCVIEASGVDFTLHDLRRTFITVADSLDIPGYAIKRLVNHKMSRDVTAGYIVPDIERLRRPIQQISDYLLHAGKSAPIRQVIHLPVARTI